MLYFKVLPLVTYVLQLGTMSQRFYNLQNSTAHWGWGARTQNTNLLGMEKFHIRTI